MVDNVKTNPVSKASFTLRGQKLTADVTDIDLLFFLGLFFLEPSERAVMRRDGSEAILESVGDRQQRQLDDAIAHLCKEAKLTEPTDEIKELATNQMYKLIAESLLHKVNTDGIVRIEAAQRFTEIFPNINPALVSFEEKIDPTGSYSRSGRIRLSAQELMELVLSILVATANLEESGKPKTPELQQELAAAQSDRPKPQGFADTSTTLPTTIHVSPTPNSKVAAEIAALSPEALEQLRISMPAPLTDRIEVGLVQ